MEIFQLFGEELGGVFNYDDISIYFSNDIVCYDKIIEIKQVNGQYEDWFLKNSMLQCALYCSFIRLGSNYLTTSNFFLKEGNDKKSIIVNPNIDYFLQFGNKLYKINVYNPTMIVNFFLNKAIASLDYESAKQFDNLYKHNEFELLKKYFRVERCYEKI